MEKSCCWQREMAGGELWARTRNGVGALSPASPVSTHTLRQKAQRGAVQKKNKTKPTESTGKLPDSSLKSFLVYTCYVRREKQCVRKSSRRCILESRLPQRFLSCFRSRSRVRKCSVSRGLCDAQAPRLLCQQWVGGART